MQMTAIKLDKMLSLSLLAFTLLATGQLATGEGEHLDQPNNGKISKFLEESELASKRSVENQEEPGTRWAILVAGSNGWDNYRHQADVCHAYQLLKQGGLKDENIVVFMYDDIAENFQNLDEGQIFNRPGGPDVYDGVPKDYTEDDVTAENFYAAILGNRSAITGGSGKVVDSGPNDYIFIYYADHGGAGSVSMPAGPKVYADDLVRVLKEKHAMGAYKQLVFYLDACHSGSMFEGLLPTGLNIYAVTSANATEPTRACYCPGDEDTGLHYSSCMSDLFSAAWMEDVENRNRELETFEENYQVAKELVLKPRWNHVGSHVQRFGDIDMSTNHLDLFMGKHDGTKKNESVALNRRKRSTSRVAEPVLQHDADLLHFQQKVRRARRGSRRAIDAQRELNELVEFRRHIDTSMTQVGLQMFGVETMNELKSRGRAPGKPIVDDWKCLKSLVRSYESHCGSLSQYGLQHMRYLANMCNAGVGADQMSKVSARVCPSIPTNPWSSLSKGFSA